MQAGNLAWPWLPELGLRVVVAVPPAVEPVTLAEAKAWAKVDTPDDDPLVSDIIVAAREQIEADLKRALITQTRTLFMSRFPGVWGEIPLPYPPLQSISSIQYADSDGTLQTLDPAKYVYTANSTPGRVWLPYGAAWPITGPFMDSVRISYVCGYGDTAASVPARVRLAMRSLIATAYRQRESHVFQQGGVIATTPVYEDFLVSEGYGFYA